MQTRFWIVLAALGTGCFFGGNGDVAPPADPAVAGEVGLDEPPPPDPPKPAVVRQSVTMLASSLKLQLRLNVAGRPIACSFPLEQGGLRLGDLPTLTYPLGHVKVDTQGIVCDDAAFAALAKIHYLRDVDAAPIQLFFEVSSVGRFNGRLDAPGTTALSQVLGTIQVDSRQQELVLQARFTRTETGLSFETVAPAAIDITAFGRASHLASLTAKAGGTLGTQAMMQVQAEFTLTDQPLPQFIRTAVTVQTMDEVRKRLDAEHDDFDVLRARMESRGVREGALDAVPRSVFDRAMEIQRAAAAQRTGTVVMPGAVSDEIQERMYDVAVRKAMLAAGLDPTDLELRAEWEAAAAAQGVKLQGKPPKAAAAATAAPTKSTVPGVVMPGPGEKPTQPYESAGSKTIVIPQ